MIVSIPRGVRSDAVSQIGFHRATRRLAPDCIEDLTVLADPGTHRDDPQPDSTRYRTAEFILEDIETSRSDVIEGSHSMPYDAPIGRTRELIEICRKVWRRERLV